MRRFLLIPASDRPAARKLAGRIDQFLGWPRQHTEDDVVRRGSAPHAPIETIRTETQMVILIHDDSDRAALRGAVAISLDAVVDSLMDRDVDDDGVTKRMHQLITDRGWEMLDALPGKRDAWLPTAPRDGAPGTPE